MAETSSLNCLYCGIPYQRLHSLSAWSAFSEKVLLFTDLCFVASPSQNFLPIYWRPSPSWGHRGRSDTAANANANSDSPQKFASDFWPPNLKQEVANYALRRNSLAKAKDFANEMAKIPFSLRNFLANGSLRQKSLAIANAMAWCTQSPSPIKTLHMT